MVTFHWSISWGRTFLCSVLYLSCFVAILVMLYIQSFVISSGAISWPQVSHRGNTEMCPSSEKLLLFIRPDSMEKMGVAYDVIRTIYIRTKLN